MGWLWNTPKDPPNADPPPSSSSSTPPFPPDEPNTTPPNDPFDAAPPSPSPSPQQEPPSPSPNPSLPSGEPITPTTLLPTTLSCRTAFDTAFHCQSIGGQLGSIYRYGTLRSCSHLWGEFWFCVRTNRGFKSDEGKREAVRAWALRREREKYGGGGDGGEELGEGVGGLGGGGEKWSSEDVWEARRWKVREAFAGDWEAMTGRRRVQEGQGAADLNMKEER